MTEARLKASEIRVSRGGRVILDGFSLSVSAGETVAVVGENGSGKTTLLQVCAGLLEAQSGAVEVSGKIGYCPQEPGLIDLLTADEHLALFGGAHGRVRDLLARLGFPAADVDTTVARDLSGGTRQKLNLALALLGDAEILLLDEPYQGFDAGTYVDFWQLTHDWRAEHRAVVVVTHLLTELHRVDRVVELGGSRHETSRDNPPGRL